MVVCKFFVSLIFIISLNFESAFVLRPIEITAIYWIFELWKRFFLSYRWIKLKIHTEKWEKSPTIYEMLIEMISDRWKTRMNSIKLCDGWNYKKMQWANVDNDTVLAWLEIRQAKGINIWIQKNSISCKNFNIEKMVSVVCSIWLISIANWRDSIHPTFIRYVFMI